MLVVGLIRHNTCAFSSLVLLVQKNDGSWRAYVDYRAVNQLQIKDRLLVPNVDELADELHGSMHFSKLDLRFGYHLIRMNE